MNDSKKYIQLLVDKIENLNRHAVCHVHEDIPKEIYDYLRDDKSTMTREEMDCIKFFISQYFDGTLEIECKHMHYAFVDGLHYDNVPKEELFYRMAEIQERCEGLGIIPRFVII